MRSERPRSAWTAGLLACVLALWVTASAAMHGVARWAEVERGHYTWHTEEWLQLLVPSNYEGRGAGRLWMYGPSESREAFLPARFDAVLSDLSAYQNSQSLGTLEEGLIALRYIEQAYGADAVPEAILLGVTTRLVGNLRGPDAPLLDAIDQYSPEFAIDRSGELPRLVAKSGPAKLRARMSFLTHQNRRYRAASFAVARAFLNGVRSGLGEITPFQVALGTSKYHHLAPRPINETIVWLSGGDLWEMIHSWDPVADRGRVALGFTAWLEFCEQHGVELYVVNMPELSHNRRMYPDGVYEAYLEAVRSSIGDTPFLDLRTFLDDADYYDSCHPNRAASERISDRIARFIAETRKARAE